MNSLVRLETHLKRRKGPKRWHQPLEQGGFYLLVKTIPKYQEVLTQQDLLLFGQSASGSLCSQTGTNSSVDRLEASWLMKSVVV